MIDSTRRTIQEFSLATPGEALWVAVSGGVDSMVLLHVLRTLGHPCHVAHVDHGLRGAESDGDRELVRAYCAAHDIPFAVKRVDVKARMATTGESTQMAARNLRLQWFQELAASGPFKVATAHHADDAIETFFLGLMQGMGARGWGSIPVRSGSIIRPFLRATREEVLAFAKAHAIPWREDASNAHGIYLRNKVRHELLPQLETWRPGTQRNLARNLRLFEELDRLARAEGERVLSEITPESDGTIRVPLERIGTVAPRLVLQYVLRDRGFHPDRFDDMLEAIREHHVGAFFPGDGVEVHIDRDHLVIAPVSVAPSWTIHSLDDLPAAMPLRITSVDASDVRPGAGPKVVWLDPDQLRFPLELRPWRAGDRMRPAGLGGSKLISDILIDAKVPRDRKHRTYVLTSGDRIIWLVGRRLSEGLKATSQAPTVLRLEWSGD